MKNKKIIRRPAKYVLLFFFSCVRLLRLVQLPCPAHRANYCVYKRLRTARRTLNYSSKNIIRGNDE